LDLTSSAVVFVADGKGSDALRLFWKRLRRSKAKVEAVAMDMSTAYPAAVSKHLSGTVIVFVQFHVIKLFDEKLSDLHRQLCSKATAQSDKQILKGTRWLLLKNPENLGHERQRLIEALKLNRPLATADYFNEELRQFWSQDANKASRPF
jgi:transposase